MGPQGGNEGNRTERTFAPRQFRRAAAVMTTRAILGREHALAARRVPVRSQILPLPYVRNNLPHLVRTRGRRRRHFWSVIPHVCRDIGEGLIRKPLLE